MADLQHMTIGGRKATVAFLDDDLLVEPEAANRAVATFDDGTVRYYHIDHTERALGGPGSGNYGHSGGQGGPGNPGGSGGEGKAGRADRVARTRIQRAKATHIPSTRKVQQSAARSERIVADAVKGQDTDDQVPMDVIIKAGGHTIGVEVKTILQGKNDKLTMHPESLARKESWLRVHKATGHTIAVDKREGSTSYYYREGFGSFRLGSMQKVTLSMLHRLVRGEA